MERERKMREVRRGKGSVEKVGRKARSEVRKRAMGKREEKKHRWKVINSTPPLTINKW